jgi:predicted nucleotide-binding protein
MPEQVRDWLKKYQAELSAIKPTQANWSAVEAWAGGVRPFLRRHFPEYYHDFAELAQPPNWAPMPVLVGGVNPQPGEKTRRRQDFNDKLASDAATGLYRFLDSLLQLDTAEELGPLPRGIPAPVATEIATAALAGMPFRPYKRPRARFQNVVEYQCATLDDRVDEEELRANGGREAVLASIRRHLPSFGPAEAQLPNGPAWVALKPILVRAGLPVGEDTTLTDIKGFLDDAAPVIQVNASGENQPMANPTRVFVIYGQNTAAYNEMVKFLRALRLEPLDFNRVGADLAQELKENPTVLQIVRRGMALAQGVVALFTPDEWAVLRPALDPARGSGEESRRWQARPNVIFEAGLAMGAAPDRTIFVKLGPDVRLFSDLGGVHLVNIGNTHKSRDYLRDRLKAAGCAVEMATNPHLDTAQAGDFVSCVEFHGELAPTDPFPKPKKK